MTLTPPSIPGSRNTPLTSIHNRAGSPKPLTSIAHVNQEANKPLTSISHVNREKNKPLTSIARVNDPAGNAATSITHVIHPSQTVGSHSHEYSAEEEEAITDSLREKYIVRRLKEKRDAAERGKKNTPKKI